MLKYIFIYFSYKNSSDKRPTYSAFFCKIALVNIFVIALSNLVVWTHSGLTVRNRYLTFIDEPSCHIICILTCRRCRTLVQHKEDIGSKGQYVTGYKVVVLLSRGES